LDEHIDQGQSPGSTLQAGRPQDDLRSRLNPNPTRAER